MEKLANWGSGKMARIAALMLCAALLAGCATAPGQIRKHFAPGHVKKVIGVNPASAKLHPNKAPAGLSPGKAKKKSRSPMFFAGPFTLP
jgi:hypothetical protein